VKELLRLLRHATNAPQIALLLAVVALLNRQHLNDLFAYIIALVFLLLPVVHFGSVAIQFWRERKLRGSGVYEKLEFTWHISEDGGFEGEYRVLYKNCSDIPQFAIPLIDFFWTDSPSNKPEIWGPSLSVESSKKWTITQSLADKPKLKFLGDRKKSFGFAFSLSVTPDIKPKESIGYSVRIKTPQSEVRAISQIGDIAGIPARLYVQSAELTYTCPPSHKFVLLEPMTQVVDMQGNQISDESIQVDSPIISSSGSRLTWHLAGLHPGHRFWFKYRIEKKNGS
jgi:hypothetical protein